MPISFVCPHCRNQLSVADAAAGRAGRCPHCKGSIQVPRGNQPAGFTAARPMQAMPPAAYAARGGRAGQSGGPWPLLIGLVGGGAALMLAALLFLLYFTPGGEASIGRLGNVALDTMEFMPDNCQFITVIRVDEFMNSQSFRDLKAAGTQMAAGLPIPPGALDGPKDASIRPEDVDYVTIGMDLTSMIPDPKAVRLTAVIQTKRDVTAEEVKKDAKDRTFTESKVGPYTFYEAPPVLPGFGVPQPGMGFTLVNKRTIVAGTMPALKTVLERNKKPEMSESMRNAARQASQPKTIAVALSVRELLARPEAKEGMEQVPPNLKGFITDLDGVVLQLNFATDIDVDLAVLMKTAESADNLRKIVEGFMTTAKLLAGQAAGPEATEIMESAKFETQGTTAKATAHIKTATLIKLAKTGAQKAGLPVNP